jgi:hypothetical protein
LIRRGDAIRQVQPEPVVAEPLEGELDGLAVQYAQRRPVVDEVVEAGIVARHVEVDADLARFGARLCTATTVRRPRRSGGRGSPRLWR